MGVLDLPAVKENFLLSRLSLVIARTVPMAVKELREAKGVLEAMNQQVLEARGKVVEMLE